MISEESSQKTKNGGWWKFEVWGYIFSYYLLIYIKQNKKSPNENNRWKKETLCTAA